MAFPNDIYEQRALENLPGLTYDRDNTKTLFAEDILEHGAEIRAIEQVLGRDVAGDYDTVDDRLIGIEESLSGIVDALWPIGSIYITMNAANPGTYLPGTWVTFAQGRTLVGFDSSQAEFNAAGKTGGEKTHRLVTAEMPAHNHDFVVEQGPTGGTKAGARMTWGIPYQATEPTLTRGGDGAHNNLQPYIACYMWRRTA